MIKWPHGIERIRNPDPLEDTVQVQDGSMTFEIAESLYRARQYDPPLEHLRWREEHKTSD